MRKFFLIFAVIITLLLSKTTCYASYFLERTHYSEWSNNLFNVIEQDFNAWFSPSQNTYRKLTSTTGATLYYRLYGNNGLVVHINILASQYGVYYIIENQWYYLGELPEVDLMLCEESCEPSDDNNSFLNNLGISGYNSSSWDNLPSWTNPDRDAPICRLNDYCSWNYSIHTCECNDKARICELNDYCFWNSSFHTCECDM